ncbi:MAG TPA: amino acid adenylation domain-containing protein, partial [Herpetosiphonaceae bacterium]
DLEGHGREDLFDEVDLSRTVGWFTSIFPVRLDLGTAQQPGAALTTIKEQLRQIPQHGIGYGLLRYLGPPEMQAALAGMPPAEVSFNYLGQIDQALPSDGWLRVAPESPGPAQSARRRGSHLLEVAGFVTGGQLHVQWLYDTACHDRATIGRLVAAYELALRALIAHCLSPDAGGYTPSDFPLARLDQPTLDRLVGHDRQIEDIYPLSPMQQGMLFHSVYASGTGVYVEQVAFRLEGALDLAALQRAWATLVERHAVFRTGFVWQGVSTPLQIVRQQVDVPWQIEDWQPLSPDRQAERRDTYLQADRRRGFALLPAPLLRLALFQVGPTSYEFVWSQHHLLLDGWSLPLVFSEIFTAYEQLIRGQEPQLARPRPYRDYIAWLQRQDLAQAEAFWRQRLDGVTAPTPLGVDQRLVDGETGHASVEVRFSEAATTAFQALAREHSLTMSTLVQGAWALLLSRYSGQPDIVYGVTVSGRPPEIAGVEQMIGIFINTLPMRVQVDPEAQVLLWLQQMQALQVEMRQYEYSPLVQIQGWSDVPRGQPLFESIVVFENYPIATSVQQQKAQSSLAISHVQSLEQSNYPLTLVAMVNRQLVLQISYDRQRFSAATIERLGGHLEHLLHGIADQPDGRLGNVPLLSEVERQRMLVDWNRSEAEYPRAAAVHELIEAQAARTPGVKAIVFEGAALSYAELNTRANQLAHYLRAQGVGPDVLVALCVERSLEMIVGMLAILKAGGAYVPLDPAYPQERLAYMLSHTRAPVILTQAALVARLPEHTAPVFRLDADWHTLAQQPTTNPPRTVQPEHLAYIIFTSGSTGRPKGVMVTQRGLINLVHGLHAYFDDPAVQTTGLITSISFDISVNQIFPTLFFGRTLHIIPDPVKFNIRALLRYLHEQQVHLLDAVPSYMQTVLNEVAPQQPPNVLRYLLIGGEKLEQRLLQSVFGQLGPQVEIVNIYGLTEISDINLLGGIRAANLGQPITVGRPLQNNRIYILDQHQQPQPIGIAGEVCVSGASVSRGYLFRPDLTAERFVPCPFEDGALMVRTGDLGRWQPDGTVEILGRIDQQVKVRGFRIETGEIEAVLAQHPQVSACVVVAREDTAPASGYPDRRLVGYVVEQRTANNEQAENLEPGTWSAELRTFLAERLPDYMIPAAFVVLDALPKTPNGKIDRKALPAPERQATLDERFVAPSNAIEELLASIWADLLDVERVGTRDNFFELGGHSLLATQLIAQVQIRFQVDIPLQDFFAAPTIAQLAQHVQVAQWVIQSSAAADTPTTPDEAEGEL